MRKGVNKKSWLFVNVHHFVIFIILCDVTQVPAALTALAIMNCMFEWCAEISPFSPEVLLSGFVVVLLYFPKEIGKSTKTVWEQKKNILTNLFLKA